MALNSNVTSRMSLKILSVAQYQCLMNRALCLIFFVSYVNIFAPSAQAGSITTNEYEKLTGSLAYRSPCTVPDINSKSYEWLNFVQGIQLELNIDRYLRNIFKKVKEKSRAASINLITGNEHKYYATRVHLKNIGCSFDGKYRLTGDLLDHVGAGRGVENAIPHSIKIKLRDGRIGNITKFKLFVPKTRRGRAEVFNVLLHKELGFVAPRTALIAVQIGGQEFNAIFQEDLSKELLEYNKFHEALIIEGDEGYAPLSNPKIVNGSFIKSDYFAKIGADVLDDLGSLYQKTSQAAFENADKSSTLQTDPPLDITLLAKKHKARFQMFHLLNFGLHSADGLSRDDHRIFYDHIGRNYHPIYYDGHAGVTKPGLSDVNFEVDSVVKKELLNRLQNIDIQSFKFSLFKHGAKYSKQEIKSVLERAVHFISSVNKSTNESSTNSDFTISKDFVERGVELLRRKNDALVNDTLKIRWRRDSQNLSECEFVGDDVDCKLINAFNDAGHRMSFEPQNLSNGIFLYSRKTEGDTQELSYVSSLRRKGIPGTSAKIEYTEGISVHFSPNKKTVHIKDSTSETRGGQVRIFGGVLKDWNFIVLPKVLSYDGMTGTRVSNLGYTGCLTFNDIELFDVSIEVRDTHCEDGVHFTRVRGNIKYLLVHNSAFDGLDADFSNLTFDRMLIKNAGNDCIDFSGGNYLVRSALLENCGDKGVSAGEESIVSLNDVKIANALVAIVAKDSSYLTGKEIIAKNVRLCSAAYRKKQEFGTGINKLDSFYCSTDTFYQQ